MPLRVAEGRAIAEGLFRSSFTVEMENRAEDDRSRRRKGYVRRSIQSMDKRFRAEPVSAAVAVHVAERAANDNIVAVVKVLAATGHVRLFHEPGLDALSWAMTEVGAVACRKALVTGRLVIGLAQRGLGRAPVGSDQNLALIVGSLFASDGEIEDARSRVHYDADGLWARRQREWLRSSGWIVPTDLGSAPTTEASAMHQLEPLLGQPLPRALERQAARLARASARAAEIGAKVEVLPSTPEAYQMRARILAIGDAVGGALARDVRRLIDLCDQATMAEMAIRKLDGQAFELASLPLARRFERMRQRWARRRLPKVRTIG